MLHLGSPPFMFRLTQVATVSNGQIYFLRRAAIVKLRVTKMWREYVEYQTIFGILLLIVFKCALLFLSLLLFS